MPRGSSGGSKPVSGPPTPDHGTWESGGTAGTMRRMSRLRIAPLLLVIALVLGACGGSDDGGGSATNDTTAGPIGARVALKDLKFDPEKVSIEAGESVLWEWKENVLHNVQGEGVESPNKSDGTFRYTFQDPGSYDYECTLHAGMTGTVEVK